MVLGTGMCHMDARGGSQARAKLMVPPVHVRRRLIRSRVGTRSIWVSQGDWVVSDSRPTRAGLFANSGNPGPGEILSGYARQENEANSGDKDVIVGRVVENR